MPPVAPDKPGRNDPGRGRRIALDVGTVRIGVAVSDSDGMIASPLETVARETGFKDRDKRDIDRLVAIAHQYRPVEIVIGLPRDLRGNGSLSVKHAKEIGFRIMRRLQAQQEKTDFSLPVIRFHDERLTTVEAQHNLHESGLDVRKSRKIIDQVAATVILQSWLDGRARFLEETRGDVTDRNV